MTRSDGREKLSKLAISVVFPLLVLLLLALLSPLSGVGSISDLSDPGKDVRVVQEVEAEGEDTSPWITVNMIVKNEAEALPRLFESMEKVIDELVICDTGSTDDTVKVVQDYIREKQIQGKVVQHQWVNFGVNRQRCLQEVVEQQQPKKNSFVLIMDADYRLKFVEGVDPLEWKTSLNKHFEGGSDPVLKLLMMEHSSSLKFYRVHMITHPELFEWKGAVHEYITTTKQAAKSGLTIQDVKVDEVYIEHLSDGGSWKLNRKEKYSAYIEMLSKDLEEHPNDTRSIFYLAQSYQDMGEDEKAYETYRQLEGLNGWAQELYIARLRSARILSSMKRDAIHEIAEAFLLATEADPTRAEALASLSLVYMNRKDFYKCEAYAMMALSLSSSKGHQSPRLLFKEYEMYDVVPWETLCTCSWYTDNRDLGKESCLKVLERKPGDERTVRNLGFYV